MNKNKLKVGTAEELGITNSGKAGIDHSLFYATLGAKAKGLKSLLINPLTRSIASELKKDWKNRTLSDEAYRRFVDTGEMPSGIQGWRPFKAFTPKMLKTGPTRQVENAGKLLGISNSKKKK